MIFSSSVLFNSRLLLRAQLPEFWRGKIRLPAVELAPSDRDRTGGGGGGGGVQTNLFDRPATAFSTDHSPLASVSQPTSVVASSLGPYAIGKSLLFPPSFGHIFSFKARFCPLKMVRIIPHCYYDTLPL